MNKIFKTEFRSLGRGFLIVDLILLILAGFTFLLFLGDPAHLSRIAIIVSSVHYIAIWSASIFSSIYFAVRYYKTHIGAQAIYFEMIPISFVKRFWGQVSAWFVHALILSLFVGLDILASLPFLVALVGQEGVTALPIQAFSYRSIPNLGLLIAICFVVSILFLSVFQILGCVNWAAVFQPLVDDRFRKFGVGGPILLYILNLVVVTILTVLFAFVISWHSIINSETGIQKAGLGEMGGLGSMTLVTLLILLVIPVIDSALLYLFWWRSQRKHLSL